ncbi:MAG: hypothetical protein ACI9C4_002985 [Paraglaciecola sp.]|jgi:hypothetical protein
MNSISINVNSIAPLVSGNHWYTKDSIALFLITSEANANGQIMKPDLAQTYTSRDCDKSIALNLDDDGNYQLARELWSDEQQLLCKGKGQYPYVELRPEKGKSGYRYYEIFQAVEVDKVSEIQMLKLVPLQSHQLVGDCKFAFGLRILPI